jgi:hypothetical protein
MGPRTPPKLAPFLSGLMAASLALSGLVVDSFYPRSILLNGLALLGMAAFG